jgi:hypothetical protein
VAFGAKPQVTDFSLKKVAVFLPMPQYAVTITSSNSQLAWQDCNKQFTRMTRTCDAAPCGPRGPVGPVGPAGPAGPCGPRSPIGPGGPGGPVSPLGAVVPWPQLATQSEMARIDKRGAARITCLEG